ncbi:MULTISPECIES: iron-siderophore ABC transporter substrate-binding protein [unclassified Paenibacillus]|uniref:ABC transporter substrate-binding protein n=1 Tax=unclassified Paenibacillus TaxID=185978 RepID=UPI001AE4A406|nr:MULTISPECIES: iron-siderophore ABC transporter substrate-binding protein [unclassified Paenibacillus]MBP1153880.1 iron complex transport system substrate-binding protein [Paenibacillus sp. PvP091]MBP1170735.1 iron complex transport system substrate-binding protein [Paenibacillus sp. PvR098]MBP2441763.1 iron complex transport system substrate-binding protein [Paenibacillus sp. PvP052]
MLSTRKSFQWKTAASLAAMMLMSVWLTACGANPSAQPAAPADKPSTPAAASEGPYKVKHAMGETEVPANPKKVVILTNEGTEALLALGVKPVAAVKSFTGNPWYDHIKTDMEGVQVVGDEHQPNLEMIAALKPDLIIGNKMRQEKIYEQLNAIAPTVFSEALRGEWKNNFKLYSEAVGKKEEGDKVIAAFDKRIEDFTSKAGDKLSQKVSVVRFMAGKTRIYLNDTFTGIIFSQIGIARPEFKDKETFVIEINKERLPEVDADKLFYFTYETGDGKGNNQENEWINDPLWKNLNAVKNGNAFKVNDVTWNTAGGVKAANILLDDLYKFYDIK